MPFRGGCYKYYPTALDFDSANKKCEDDVKSFMSGAKKGIFPIISLIAYKLYLFV